MFEHFPLTLSSNLKFAMISCDAFVQDASLLASVSSTPPIRLPDEHCSSLATITYLAASTSFKIPDSVDVALDFLRTLFQNLSELVENLQNPRLAFG